MTAILLVLSEHTLTVSVQYNLWAPAHLCGGYNYDSTANRPPFDAHSTTRRPTLYIMTVVTCVCGLLHCDLKKNKLVIVTAASGLRHCDLNDLLQEVQRPSNRSQTVVM